MIFKNGVFKILVPAIAATLLGVTSAQAAINVGDKAPALVVTDLADNKIDLSNMQGKTVIVTLWASWCPPCLKEMPMLRDFYHKYEDQGIEIIALSLDHPHDKKAVEKIAAKVDYHVAMASEATTNGFETSGSLPVIYVINGDGDVSTVFDQPVTEQDLARAVLP